MIKRVYLILIIITCTFLITSCVASKKTIITDPADVYDKLNSLLVWDGVAPGKDVSIELFLKDSNDEAILFEGLEIPVRIQLYSETAPGSKQKVRLLYNKTHTIRGSLDSKIVIPKEDIDYTSTDKSSGITVAQVKKPDGEVVVEETTRLPLYLLLN